MSNRIRNLAIAALAALAAVGCNKSAPGSASGPAWGPRPAAGDAPAVATANPTAPASGSASCAEVFDCVSTCSDEACSNRCLDRATGAPRAAAIALGECITSSGCQDQDCVVAKCNAEATACSAAGGSAPSDPTPSDPTVAGTAPTGDAAPIVGTWATSSAQGGIGYVQWNWGAVRRRYVFSGDGTFTYHSEYWYGNDRPDQWMLVDQRGTWSASGDEITIAPTTSSARVVDRDGKRLESVDAPAETMTYHWQFHFFEGIAENDLILSPETGTETRRDGAFGSNDAFPRSYFLSQTYHPEWQFNPD